MHDGERFIPMFEKAHYTINLLQRLSRGRGNNGKVVFRYALQQWPVSQVAAGNLHEVKTVFDDHVHGSLVPRSAHGKETGLQYRVFDAPILIPGKPSF